MDTDRTLELGLEPLLTTSELAGYLGVHVQAIYDLRCDGRGSVGIRHRTRREASVAIASNESFSGWTKTFTDPRLCAAIVDRLTFNGTILETGTASYRLNHARQLHTT